MFIEHSPFSGLSEIVPGITLSQTRNSIDIDSHPDRQTNTESTLCMGI